MRSNDVAKLAGVTVRTLRHYHQLGLLSEPSRQANGYRDYSPADVARVLRIKRLAGLGFPLSRIGDVLDEMDAEGNATSASVLDELDRELALEIEHLQEQRYTIAELRAEHLDPDLPVRFARILRMLSGVDTLAAAPVAVFTTSLVVEGAGVSVAALALAGCWMLITVWALNTHSLKYLDDKESHPDPIPFVPDAERV